MSDTPLSCDTVGLELKRAVLCSLLCPETDWNIRIGKQLQGYVFIYLLILRSDVLMFRIPDISQCVNNYLRLRKAEFITGLDIATHWSPMRPKIERWRLNFQNWSPAGDSHFVR